MIQQEESQRETLNNGKRHEVAAMYCKVNNTNTSKTSVSIVCKIKGHNSEDCWNIIGYPKWHIKHKKNRNRSQTGSTFRISGKWRQNNANQMVSITWSCYSWHENDSVILITTIVRV